MDLENDPTYLSLVKNYTTAKERAFETGFHSDMRVAAEWWLELHQYMNQHDTPEKTILDLVTGDFKRQHQLFLKIKGGNNE
jgi:predicted GNAT superfamily acetyltransferase